ncbi:potassium-transporting ATPase subunit KdpC [Brevibacillus daliensis]|uniref:potassium-transporting ATPase subunit KdpC n=1 Tax=Brevibacillus daliensis TaxID=2892995 RepID=UPI001E4E6558|nr:potassium-transporting ATPase subunit KdpC [Brevibacillus daliensis]
MLKNLRVSLLLLIICGLIYPLAMTGIAQAIMPYKADGSLIVDKDGTVIGSELIGQKFTEPGYFIGRVSSIEYNAAGSGSNNYAPSNPAMIERTEIDLQAFLAANPDIKQEDVPADLMTNSASGLDPHLSPKAAKVQVPRIAKERNMDPNVLYQLVDKHIEGRSLGLFGEPRVNVLKLNMALDQLQ